MMMMISMEHWCNDTDRGKPKYWEKILTHYRSVHHKISRDQAWDGTRVSAMSGRRLTAWAHVAAFLKARINLRTIQTEFLPLREHSGLSL